MTRKVKAFGLAIVAAFAMSAVVTSAASAQNFHSDLNSTVLTGTSENTQTFVRGSTTIECDHAVFTGTQTGATTKTVVIEADYTTGTCSGPLDSEVHVDFTTDDCGYHFELTAEKTAAAKLDCEEGGSVTITPTAFGSSLCTIHVPEQTVDGHVVFSNIAGDDVTVNSTASGIDSERTGSSLCGAVNNGTGTYTGNAVVAGESHAGVATKISVS